MKHLSKLLVALLVAMSFSSAIAQSENQPWAIKVGSNAIDFLAEKKAFEDGRIFQTRKWNILPSISELSVSRYIKSGFSLTLGGSLNRIERVGTIDLASSPVQQPIEVREGVIVEPEIETLTLRSGEVLDIDDSKYYSLEGMLSYDLRHAFKKPEGWFAPFVGLGGGINWIDDQPVWTANFSLGADFWINENFALSLDSTYKGNIAEYDTPENNINYKRELRTFKGQSSHLQHSFGVKFAFGGKDTDGDGIVDKKDKCPEVAGLKKFDGCPDSDGDGIVDSEDACPNTPQGDNGANGCPDSDGDGIVNKDDACPEVAGKAELNGCPDSDNDGVANNIDACPNEPGPVANNGCPYKDADGDGILDKDDKCPEVAGVKANNGCPEVPKAPSVEVQKQLNDYAKTILFDSGRSTIKSQSEVVLRDIISILNEYPKANFTIDGHTDSLGSATSNQRLSDSRANAVKAFLINGGVSSNRLTAKGYGESTPIADNKTKAGRKLNRRVEINLVK